MPTTFRDYAMRSTALVTSYRPQKAAVEPLEKESVEDSQPIIYDTPEAALASLRRNRPQGRIIGKRGTPYARHITYAWKPIVRRIFGDNVVGQVALHVYHATKGFKICHGFNNRIEHTPQVQEGIKVIGS